MFDLSPLQGMNLTTLICDGTQVSDLSPLRGMSLTFLRCDYTQVSDLSPLRGMPLQELWCFGAKVSDLSPLQGMSLSAVRFKPNNITKGMGEIRQMKGLKRIGISFTEHFSPTEFWKKYDAGEFGKPITNISGPAFQQWIRDVQALPAEKQIAAVSRKLAELNPGFDGKLTAFEGKGTPKIENGVVTELGLLSDSVTDISPIRALMGLKSLSLAGSGTGKGQIADWRRWKECR